MAAERWSVPAAQLAAVAGLAGPGVSARRLYARPRPCGPLLLCVLLPGPWPTLLPCAPLRAWPARLQHWLRRHALGRPWQPRPDRPWPWRLPRLQPACVLLRPCAFLPHASGHRRARRPGGPLRPGGQLGRPQPVDGQLPGQPAHGSAPRARRLHGLGLRELLQSGRQRFARQRRGWLPPGWLPPGPRLPARRRPGKQPGQPRSVRRSER